MANTPNSLRVAGPAVGAERFEELGALVEALGIADECIKRGSDGTLTEKLAAIGISKDYYYARAKEFRKITGLELTEQIEEHSRHPGEHNPSAKLLQEYRAIVEQLYETAWSIRSAPQIRVGVGEILCRPLVPHALRQFASAQPNAKVAVEIGWSRHLRQLFEAHHFDLVVAQAPSQIAPSSDLVEKSFSLPFWFVCPHKHQIVNHLLVKSGRASPSFSLQELKGTLVLIGPNTQRSYQFEFHRKLIRDSAPQLRIVEVDTFLRAHDMVVCGASDDVATITVPEFLEEDRLRDLTLVPLSRITEFSHMPVDPFNLSVLRRDSASPAIGALAAEFETGLLSKDTSRIVKWLGAERHVYYERTKETSEGEGEGKGPRSWAHSIIRWHFLKSGHVVGQHTVNDVRGPGGKYEGEKQTFNILGRLIENPLCKHEYHLVWSGVNEEQEAYVASFVIPPETYHAGVASNTGALSSEGDIVGVWTGRRTSKRAFEPSAGYMLISLQPDDWQLNSDGENVAQQKQTNILDHLTKCVEKHESRFPGLKQDALAKCWEWQTSGGRQHR